MKIKNAVIAGVLAFGIANAAATPVTISFSGTQWADPQSIRGAPNVLGLSAGQSVHGSITFDTAGLTDTQANLDASQYANAVKAYNFEAFSGSQSNLSYSYVFIDAATNSIQLYASRYIGPNDFSIVEVILATKAGVIQNESYDIATLKASDIVGLGNLDGSNWFFQPSYDLFLPTYNTVIYHGALTSVEIATAPVPEPETYAMMLVGLGLLGVVARRRKQG